MLAFIDANNNAVPWNGEPIEGEYHPLDIESLWTPDQLVATGLYPVHLFVVPPGRVGVGQPTYTLVGIARTSGTYVTQTLQTQAAPPPILPIDATDDADAASKGVVVGQFYRTGSDLMVRVS